MKLTPAALLSGALVWTTTGLATWAWFTLPDGAGVPFNSLGFDGQRHTGVSREALWAIPVAAPAAWTAITFAPRFIGLKVEEVAPELYDALLIATCGMLLAVEAGLVASAFDGGFDPLRPAALATAALLLAIGNYLGKARQNRLVGVRTPWTLADARVWDKTHRFAGRGMMLGGAALIGLGIVLRGPVALAAAMAACAALPVLASVAWSWRLHHRGA